MIQSITIKNHAGESIVLEMRFPEKSGFLIQDIDGLNPCKATINTTDISSGDGSVFNSARMGTRNILLSLGFWHEPSVEENRLKSYRYFPIKRPIVLTVKTDDRTCVINGFVESNDIDIFTKAEKAAISIVCPDPYFYSLLKQITVFGSEEALFEFPFSNESLAAPLLVFSELHSDTRKTIYYDGDGTVGMKIYIHASGSASNLTIYDLTTQEIMSIDSTKLIALTGSDISAGDELVISTLRGKKSITLIRNGVEINILNCLSKDASWFQLVSGDNVLAYSSDTGLQNLQFRVENDILFEGV